MSHHFSSLVTRRREKMVSKLLVVKLVSFMMLFAVSHARWFRLGTARHLSELFILVGPKQVHNRPTQKCPLTFLLWCKHTPDQLPPSNTPTRKHQSPYTLTPELPPSSPTTELPSWYTPTPELPPPSYNPTPVFPPSYTATPELPPSYMPTPEVPAPSPAPY
ncbi:unnamed protein product [Brassica oleracea]